MLVKDGEVWYSCLTGVVRPVVGGAGVLTRSAKKSSACRRKHPSRLLSVIVTTLTTTMNLLQIPRAFCLLQIPRVFRLPQISSALTRNYSALRSNRTSGPRGIRGRKPAVAGIPDNATKACNALLRPSQNPVEIYNPLLTPVHVPEDSDAILTSSHPAARLLENSSLVIQRQLELGNLIMYEMQTLGDEHRLGF